jgi:RNA polymerase sigma factor (sigma-70 family)
LDEATLVQRAKDGDVDAYQQLVRCHQAVAFRVAVLIARNTADARDAANDGVVKAFYGLGRFRADAPFRPWLLRIVANEARNGRRSAGRRDHLAGRVQLASRSWADVAPSPEEAVMVTLEHQALFAAIGRLAQPDREVIALRYLAELSEAETAAALGCALGTAKSRLHRALSRLRVTMLADANPETRSARPATESKASDV